MNVPLSITSLLLLSFLAAAQEPDEPTPPPDRRPDALEVQRDRELRQLSMQRQRLSETVHETRKELESASRVLHEHRDIVSELEARLMQLSLQGHGAGLGDGLGGADLARMRNQLDEVSLEHSVMLARREAIEKQIVELSVEIDRRVAGDELVKELEKAVGLQQEMLQRAMALSDQGTVSASQVVSARLSIIEARTRLAEHRMMIADRSGGSLVIALRERLVEVEIELRVHEVRATLMEERLQEKSALAEKLGGIRGDLERELSSRMLALDEAHVQVNRHQAVLAALQEKQLELELRMESQGR